MATDLQSFVESKQLAADEITTKTKAIYESVLSGSSYLDSGNFTVIHQDDLEMLFDLYDRTFFDRQCQALLGDTPLSFRLSKRMTQAGGKATRREIRHRNGQPASIEYEIAVATTLLFNTFQGDDPPVSMSGIECHNRLQALQRVFEHELVHLIEMLIWNKSSCSAARFQSIANRVFGHTEHRHQLITPRKRALTQYGIRSGDRVSFRIDGRHYTGFVNRITKRATVLVPDARGLRYSDGKCYAKYYVPVGMLEPADEQA